MNPQRYLRDKRHAHLLTRARQGDSGAFRKLYGELYDPLARYLSLRLTESAEVEDLLSKVFYRFLEHMGRFDPSRGSVLAWLLSMARNALVDHYRERRPTVQVEQLADFLVGNDGDHLARIIRDEEARRVHALLREYPAEIREMLALRFSESLRYREIADCMGLSEAAVKQRFSRTLRELRIRLAGHVQKGGEVDYAV